MEEQNERQLVPKEKFTLQPKDLSEALEFAKLMASSDLVPKEYKDKPANVLMAVQLGQEVGLSPMQSIQNIAIINGRPCMWGDVVLGLVKASGKQEYTKEYFNDKKEAVCETKRVGEDDPIIRIFSWDDAVKSGLSRKGGTWQTYPKRMMQMRARAFALRDAYPDVLKGIGIREEVQDYFIETATPAMPQRKSEITEAEVNDVDV